MKLARGQGSAEKGGGCWMALADYYTRGNPRWHDHPQCVDPLIRTLCILLNDYCEDGEREQIIGPHLWSPIGTRDDDLQEKRKAMVTGWMLRFLDRRLPDTYPNHAINLLKLEPIFNLKDQTGILQCLIVSSLEAISTNSLDLLRLELMKLSSYSGLIGDRFKSSLLDLILRLCALSSPDRLPPGAVTQEKALEVVCGIS